jgi:hypothetical protein
LSRITPDELERLNQAVHALDYLEHVVREIETLQRVVFYANPRADWRLQRRSAEQILIAEIVYRYQRRPEQVLAALQAIERSGQTWEAAVGELAAAIHSYYTTPLGLVMRQDLFGPQAVFLTPDAYAWADQTRGHPAGPSGETP